MVKPFSIRNGYACARSSGVPTRPTGRRRGHLLERRGLAVARAAIPHWRVDPAGRDRVDPGRRELEGQRACEGAERAVDGGDHRAAGHRPILGDARGERERAARPHAPTRVLGEQHRGEQLGVDERADRAGLDGGNGRVRSGHGRDHEMIEGAGRLEQAHDVGLVRGVGDDDLQRAGGALRLLEPIA